MHLSHLFQRTVNMHADRPALATGMAAPLTYAAFAARVNALAHLLRDGLRLRPGDRVGIAMKNCAQYAEAMWACWSAQLCVVPVNNKLHPKEVAYILEDSQARLCISQGPFLEELRQCAAANGPEFLDVNGPQWQSPGNPAAPLHAAHSGSHRADELAWLFYTSGTTGKPKGVMLTHANLVAMALNFHADMLAIDSDDALIHVAPMSHGSGLYGIPYVMRGGLQVVSESGGFDEAELTHLLQGYGKASLFAAPTIVTRMVQHVRSSGQALTGLRNFLVGGAPFYAEDIKQAVHTFGARVAQMYGQGETPMTISAIRCEKLAQAVHDDNADVLSSVGYPQTTVDVRIEDEGGIEQPPGALGEIVVYGATVMQGYWNNEAATAKTLVNGGLRTGDVGLVDANGLLHLRDRSKDVIISGGTNIYPREVEDALLCHPAVQEVSVIGTHDDDWGEVVTAIVVAHGEVTDAELDATCIERIARFKRPKRYIYLQHLPKNPTGKVLKNELRSLAAKAAGLPTRGERT
ncbi:AMP-binding protein [Diaphorobacter ruginosibacter]|uniref:AMP-binding protein n=1 Tax=Diaphorobacter ruginosibacter TaxID=1715720 RepID=UPI0033406E97